MSCLTLRRVIPVLIISTFSSILVQASGQKDSAEELNIENKQRAVTKNYPNLTLNIPIFSGGLAEAPIQTLDQKYRAKLCINLIAAKAVTQLYLEYKQGLNDLRQAKDILKREETKAEEREALAMAGEFVRANDPRSTAANFNNGYASLADVFKSQSELLASHPAPDDPIHEDPLVYYRKEVQQKGESLSKTGILLKELLEITS